MKLYVVGTPLGNLSDWSPRAAETLQQADFIAAEDTRVTMKLLNFLGLKKPLVSYHEHNKHESGPRILSRIAAGECCALVTDAGMPAISDPGEELIRAAHEAHVAVESVPGPTAFATALAVSGMPSKRFCFEGFLSQNKSERRAHLDELRTETRTMLFYEAPHKLKKTLADLCEVFGQERPVALVRELTKLHEQTLRMTLGEACDYYTEETPPRGEFVIIVGGKPLQVESQASADPNAALALAKQLQAQGLSASAAAKEAARQTGCKKGEIYKLLTED